jgi:hypothetical protein
MPSNLKGKSALNRSGGSLFYGRKQASKTKALPQAIRQGTTQPVGATFPPIILAFADKTFGTNTRQLLDPNVADRREALEGEAKTMIEKADKLHAALPAIGAYAKAAAEYADAEAQKAVIIGELVSSIGSSASEQQKAVMQADVGAAKALGGIGVNYQKYTQDMHSTGQGFRDRLEDQVESYEDRLKKRVESRAQRMIDRNIASARQELSGHEQRIRAYVEGSGDRALAGQAFGALDQARQNLDTARGSSMVKSKSVGGGLFAGLKKAFA